MVFLSCSDWSVNDDADCEASEVFQDVDGKVFVCHQAGENEEANKSIS